MPHPHPPPQKNRIEGPPKVDNLKNNRGKQLTAIKPRSMDFTNSTYHQLIKIPLLFTTVQSITV